MKLKLQEYAMIAEILGGVAVIVTLLFLVFETRENTNAIQAQTYQSLTSELNEIRRTSISADMADIREKLQSSGLDSLSGTERFRYISNRQALWGVYESSFYARERDILGDLEWERFGDAICRNYSSDSEFWTRSERGGSISGTITETFLEYIESSCQLD